jgi:hypothetical protein
LTAPCGCCEPSAPLTPVEVENRPALSAIAYRIGTYGSFRETMLGRIARAPELASLTTRRDDDHAIAVLDLWAAVADVLAFYQERYANEAFLRTATRRESIARLARLIDYRPRSGIAALATLAFTVEVGSTVEVSRGSRVQSVPGQDERPQVFETLEALRADARLNRLRALPEPVSANPFERGGTGALLAPGEVGLRAARELVPGDRILLHGAAGSEQVTVKEVRVEGELARLVWEPPLQLEWRKLPTVRKVGRSFRLFGHDVPPQTMQPVENSDGEVEWRLAQTNYILGAREPLPLDARYDGLVAGAQLLVVSGKRVHAVTARAPHVGQESLQGYRGSVTYLPVDPTPFGIDRRSSAVHELLGDPIPFWGHEYPDRLRGATVMVPGYRVGKRAIEIGATIERLERGEGVEIALEEIEVGRRVLVGDERTAPVPARIEQASIVTRGEGLGYLRLELAPDAALDLDPHTAFVLGNVAEASQGETVHGEVLGEADPAASFQRFALRRKPLTYLPSAAEGGAEAAVEVRVNGVRWRQVPSFHGRAPTDEVFVLGQDEEGAATVQLGDGVRGARPARGSVTATYRTGSGLAGRVRRGTLETPLDRPVGLRDVTNPLPARGGADAESPEGARENAPQTVRTLGRAVSLRDFEDLARSSGEVAKASAISVWNGWARAIHLTVAGQAGAPFDAEDLGRLAAAMRTARDPNHRFATANRSWLPVLLGATVEVDPDRIADEVLEAARSAASAALSFDSLRLAEPLHLSDLYAGLQEVEGVVGVDIYEFQPKRPEDRERPNVDRLTDGSPAPLQPHIRAYPARPDPDRIGAVLPAELARIEEPSRDLTIVLARGVAP